MAEFLPILLVFLWPLFLLSALGGAGYLAWRTVRALEAKGASAPELVALRERVELLEEQLEAQSAELRRVADGQQFTEKLLENRAGKGL